MDENSCWHGRERLGGKAEVVANRVAKVIESGDQTAGRSHGRRRHTEGAKAAVLAHEMGDRGDAGTVGLEYSRHEL